MKKNITYLCMAAAALLVSSCTQNEEITPTIENEGRVPVLFTAKNSAVLETKVNDYLFASDEIGISMLSADDKNAIETNVCFKPDGSGTGEVTLSPYNGVDPIYYPTDGSNVQFNAYLPYKTSTSNTITWIFNEEEKYVFYTATTKGDGKTYNESTGLEQSVSLVFKHRLARISIDIESKDYEVGKGVTATLSNHPVSFDYNILIDEITFLDKDKQPLNALPSGNLMDFYVLPEALTQAETVTMNLPNGVSFEATLTPPADGFKAGVQYKYKTTLTATKTQGTFKATLEGFSPQEMGPLTSEEVPVEP